MTRDYGQHQLKMGVDEKAVIKCQEMVRMAEPVPGILSPSAGIDGLRLLPSIPLHQEEVFDA